MASTVTIKAIESSTVHQIQSGQVIVDLCSVAKELVENSIDAGATTIEVRFKNQGLDSIEVQDNGAGIAPHNYETVALKHYTSKLSSYDDLSTLQTFGFRGEALSSLCALSRFSIVTCTQQEAPRATRLEFETSGKLKSTSVVSGQRGTTVIVENLFHSLPVRRRELERNIKREWGKVISLLNQYACVQTGVKFTVSQQPTKGKRMVLFSTRGNPTTRENIINVFGVKTMNALITMDLTLQLIPTAGAPGKGKAAADDSTTEVRVIGHVSRPTHGEGRQTPDRQMFYVNGRPCGLPQFAKVFNEVYRSYNSTQSPFIFADIQLDTHLYDVNVSPDKRTILLHDQGQMLDNLRESLIELFETQDVTIPVSQASALKQTPFKARAVPRSETPSSAQNRASLTIAEERRRTGAVSPDDRDGSSAEEDNAEQRSVDGAPEDTSEAEIDDEDGPRSRAKAQETRKPARSAQSVAMLSRWLKRDLDAVKPSNATVQHQAESATSEILQNKSEIAGTGPFQAADTVLRKNPRADGSEPDKSRPTSDNGAHDRPAWSEERSRIDVDMRESQKPNGEPSTERNDPEPPVLAIPPPSQPLASRPGHSHISSSRPLKRPTEEIATITIGNHTVTSVIGNRAKRSRIDETPRALKTTVTGKVGKRNGLLPSFGGKLSQLFSASAPPVGGGSDELAAVEDGVEEDMEADSGRDEEDEDSLFVSQGGNGEPDDEDDDTDAHGEVEDQAPTEISDQEIPSDAGDSPEVIEWSPSSDDGGHTPEGVENGDEEEKKGREEERVENSIGAAEPSGTGLVDEGEKRSETFLKGRLKRKHQTLNLVQHVKSSSNEIRQRITRLEKHTPRPRPKRLATGNLDGLEADDAEERLSLKISKSDFAKMRIVGQFNLGFILAVREASPSSAATDSSDDDELFIIDQHASDEKYNFERLQATTTVQSQRLVQPKTLDLTALEEEIILEHLPALERNGFVVAADTSGAKPVGSRIQLLSLPLSRETTFSLSDLEELVFLLADNPTSSATTVPRPSKVRKMFAMRACRSSIMIGRALSGRQMERVVRHMGEMDKPWNCPHGRPTMRHLCGLGGAWDGKAWVEGDDVWGGGGGGREGSGRKGGRTKWAAWVREKRGEEE